MTNHITNKFKFYVKMIIVIIRMYPIARNHRINQIQLLKKTTRKKGQNRYIVEYLEKYPMQLVKQGDILKYCDDRRNKDSNGEKPNFRDNSRGIEILRKDKHPYCWREVKIEGVLYIAYIPELKELVTTEIVYHSKNRSKCFSKYIINSKLEKANYKCMITGLDVRQGRLAADHWIPKEKGGKNELQNCIILNKQLNEKKNNNHPVDWFGSTILNNFLKACKDTGMNINDVKHELIDVIQEF
tara:strand:+ start:181 stop:906 length:726 start_codon:yes stop_codon:yes gene_type:complete